MASSKEKNQQTVIIIGAGWAGLSAALKMARQGKHVTLLEASPQPGGRARGIRYQSSQSPSQWIDNGQHLFIGAYHGIKTILGWLDLPLEDYFSQYPFKLDMQTQTTRSHFATVPMLPKPLHALAGLLFRSSFPWSEKWALIRSMRYLSTISIQKLADNDFPVIELLHRLKQPPSLIKRFWEPLCVAALTTPINHASSHLFINLLRISFLQEKQHSDLWFPTKNLSDTLPTPIISYLERNQHQVLYRHRAKHLLFPSQNPSTTHSAIGVECSNGKTFYANDLILATHASAALPLLKAHSQHIVSLAKIVTQLEQLQYQSVMTVYLFFNRPFSVSWPMLGFTPPQLPHWVFHHAFCGHPERLACVISANGNHIDKKRDDLLQQILHTLQPHLPPDLQLVAHKWIHEKQAAFSATPGIDANRPSQETGVPHLYLAGDYLQNGLPACLEGAIQSGLALTVCS